MTGSVALDLVRAGLGVTLFPRWTVQDQLRAGDLAPARIGKRGLWLDWCLATRREPADAPLEGFLTLMRSLHPLADM